MRRLFTGSIRPYVLYIKAYKGTLPTFLPHIFRPIHSVSHLPESPPPPPFVKHKLAIHYSGMPTAVISNATRIWEINVHWSLFSQCGIWDPKGRGVDIWECIRDHDATPGTQVGVLLALPVNYNRTLVSMTPPLDVHAAYGIPPSLSQPPNSVYWRYLGRR